MLAGPYWRNYRNHLGDLRPCLMCQKTCYRDDVGVVAAEDYRQSLYDLMGFTGEGECAPSPEI